MLAVPGNTGKIIIKYEVSWMDATFLNNNKVFECKLGLFDYAHNISKRPTGSAHVGNFINYLLHLPAPFHRGLGIDLERSSTFLPFAPSMHINKLGLFSHF